MRLHARRGRDQSSVYISNQGHALGIPFKGFYWICCTEDLTSRIDARVCQLPINVKVESRGKHGGRVVGSIWRNSRASSKRDVDLRRAQARGGPDISRNAGVRYHDPIRYAISYVYVFSVYEFPLTVALCIRFSLNCIDGGSLCTCTCT